MPALVYSHELMDALARVFAEAALNQLIREIDSEVGLAEQQRPVTTDTEAGTHRGQRGP
jgi:hypothetical protein